MGTTRVGQPFNHVNNNSENVSFRDKHSNMARESIGTQINPLRLPFFCSIYGKSVDFIKTIKLNGTCTLYSLCSIVERSY